MQPIVRLAGGTALFLAIFTSEPARVRGDDLAPPPKRPTVHKVVIENGLAHTVKYFVEGGSPRLHAMYRILQWAENEVVVVEQLQLLKLDYVTQERRLSAFTTVQQTTFGYPPLWATPGCGAYGSESSLKGALAGVLADEATPAGSMQILRMLEEAETQLAAELKKLPAEERPMIQKRVEALRKAVAALPSPTVLPARRPVPGPFTALSRPGFLPKYPSIPAYAPRGHVP